MKSSGVGLGESAQAFERIDDLPLRFFFLDWDEGRLGHDAAQCATEIVE